MPGLWRRAGQIAGAGLCCMGITPLASAANDLSQLSLEELGNVEVTSVSKSPELLRNAPAVIYVITHDDVVRSGATSLSEALRLAPNLRITQLDSSNYVAAARGFGGNPDVQNFSNKLLLLIDGRSVYTPLFSGIDLDTQDAFLSDIDRIEVISGPGATLWGANAVNGVINIITKNSAETQGTYARAGAGSEDRIAGIRYGGTLGPNGHFRAHVKYVGREGAEAATGPVGDDS